MVLGTVGVALAMVSQASVDAVYSKMLVPLVSRSLLPSLVRPIWLSPVTPPGTVNASEVVPVARLTETMLEVPD